MDNALPASSNLLRRPPPLVDAITFEYEQILPAPTDLTVNSVTLRVGILSQLTICRQTFFEQDTA